MTETTETTEKPPETKPEPQQWTKPPGYDPVDLDALGITEPEKKAAIEARFRHLYTQAKTASEVKRENRELREHLDKLTEAVEKIQAKDFEQERANTLQQIKLARDEGRVEDEVKLLAGLNKVEPKVEKPEVKTEDYVKAAQGWASETNPDGTLKRPWILEDHPDNTVALGVLHKVRAEWAQKGIEITPQTTPLLLDEIDKRMTKTQAKPTAPQVLATSQVRPQKKPDDVELNQDQKLAARRLYSHLPADKAEAAYAKAYGALKTAGMAR